MTKGVVIGLRNVVYALLSQDPESGVATYEAPVAIKGAITANVNPNASSETLFADDGPYETATSLGAPSLELNVADLTLVTQAAMFGHSLVGGVLIRKASDVPPWLAIGFKSLKSNGKYRYTWLAKGKFGLPEQNNETKGDSVAFQTATAEGSFVRRDCDDEWERHIDEDDVDYVASMGTNWFNSPYGGTADTVAPTISSVVPADEATGVAAGSSVVWTFSKALALSTVTKGNFTLVNNTTGVSVACDLSINSQRTVVTLAPKAALTTAVVYSAIVTQGVADVAGNPLDSASITTFTVA